MSMVTATRHEMSYCPGCSHGGILEQIGAGLDRLGVKPEQVCLVSDIGCIGTADKYFACHTFHGLHGRAITYAEGIKRQRPDLLVIVLIGDGGCGIGTSHLVHSARRGVGIKVFVCNNFTFGMTGGQHSVTTPQGGVTATTPGGSADPPLDISQLAVTAGASYVARCTAFDKELPRYVDVALRCEGFALLEIWELCVAYYMPMNKLTPPALLEMAERFGMRMGVLREPPTAEAPPLPTPGVKPRRQSSGRVSLSQTLSWPGRREILVAGSAGERIRSAVGVIGEIMVAGGLWAAQLDDYPITVRKGHSLSNLIVSDRPIRHSGVGEPDLLVIQSEDGLKRLGSLEGLPPSTLVVANDQLDLPATRASVRRVSLKRAAQGIEKTTVALALLTFGLIECGWIAPEALVAAAEVAVAGKFRDANLQAIRAGLDGRAWGSAAV